MVRSLLAVGPWPWEVLAHRTHVDQAKEGFPSYRTWMEGRFHKTALTPSAKLGFSSVRLGKAGSAPAPE